MPLSFAELWRAFRGKQEYDADLVGLILCDLRNLHRGPDDPVTTLETLWREKAPGPRRQAPGKKKRRKNRRDAPIDPDSPTNDRNLPVMEVETFFDLMFRRGQ